MTDGLSAGGLIVDPRVAAGNSSNLWVNAKLPTQTTSNGQTTVTVQQTAQRAIATWQQFNVGRNTTLYFDQSGGNSANGNSWTILNRIDATGSPSQILGQIRAEGTVLIINPNGIIFNGTSQINVHTLIASAMDMNSFTGTANGAFKASGDAYVPISVSGLTQTTPNGTLILAPSDEANANTTFLSNGLFTNARSMSLQRQHDHHRQYGAVLGRAHSRPEQCWCPGPGRRKHQHRRQRLRQWRLCCAVGAAGEQCRLDQHVGRADHPGGGFERADRQAGVEYDVRRAISSDIGVLADQRNAALCAAVRERWFARAQRRRRGADLAARQYHTERRCGRTARACGSDDQHYPGRFDHHRGERDRAEQPVLFGTKSVTAILPEENGETIPSDPTSLASFVAPRIDVSAPYVDFQSGSWVLAPSATMSVTGPGQTSPDGSTLPPIGRVLMESGSSIDLSGLTATRSVSDYIYTFKVTTNDVADTPLARNLVGQTVTIDLTQTGTRADGETWVGSPLFASSGAGYLANVTQGIDQLLTKGGSLTFGSGTSVGNGQGTTAFVDVLQAQGAKINVSGGLIQYTGARIATTRVIGSDGRNYDISNADPFLTNAIVAGFKVDHPRAGAEYTEYYSDALHGSSYDKPGYFNGISAGGTSITAVNPVLEGDLAGEIVIGANQRRLAQRGTGAGGAQATPDQLPQGSRAFDLAGRQWHFPGRPA